MALTRNRPIFSDKWVDRLKGAPESAMIATVSIYYPDDVTATLVGKKYETVINYTKQDVKARVQPVRAPVQKFISTGGTDIQNVRISMPIDERVEMRPQMRVVVTSSPLNPKLTGFVYIAKEVMDSSNPLEWTIECEVDTEVVNGS